VAAVGRRRGDQHGLPVLEIAKRRVRHQDDRVFLLRLRQAGQETHGQGSEPRSAVVI